MRVSAYKNWLPLTIIIISIVTFYSLGLQNYFSINSLRTHLDFLQTYYQHHPALTAIYILIALFITTAIPTPCPFILTLMAGSFSPAWVVVLTVCIGEVLGGLVLRYAVQTSLGTLLYQSQQTKHKSIIAAMNKNAFTYTLILRLSFFGPSWLLNIAAGLIRMPIKTYILATLLGTLVPSYFIAKIGRGISTILLSNEPITPVLLLKPVFFVPLACFLCIIIGIQIYQQKIKNKKR